MSTVVIVPASSAGLYALMPGELLSQVECLRNGGTYFPADEPGDFGLRLPPPPPEYHPAAPAALAAIEPLCGPAREAPVRQWLNTLATAVQQPPTEEEMPLRIAAILFKCHDIPAGAWSQESLLEAMGVFDWWPSVAKLHALLSRYADRITGTRDALRRIVDAANRKPPPTPPKAPDRGEAARRHVRGVVAAFERERALAGSGMVATPAKPVAPSPLSDGALLTTYEKLAADGAPGAQIRLAALRRRLNASAGGG